MMILPYQFAKNFVILSLVHLLTDNQLCAAQSKSHCRANPSGIILVSQLCDFLSMELGRTRLSHLLHVAQPLLRVLFQGNDSARRLNAGGLKLPKSMQPEPELKCDKLALTSEHIMQRTAPFECCWPGAAFEDTLLADLVTQPGPISFLPTVQEGMYSLMLTMLLMYYMKQIR